MAGQMEADRGGRTNGLVEGTPRRRAATASSSTRTRASSSALIERSIRTPERATVGQWIREAGLPGRCACSESRPWGGSREERPTPSRKARAAESSRAMRGSTSSSEPAEVRSLAGEAERVADPQAGRARRRAGRAGGWTPGRGSRSCARARRAISSAPGQGTRVPPGNGQDSSPERHLHLDRLVLFGGQGAAAELEVAATHAEPHPQRRQPAGEKRGEPRRVEGRHPRAAAVAQSRTPVRVSSRARLTAPGRRRSCRRLSARG